MFAPSRCRVPGTARGSAHRCRRRPPARPGRARPSSGRGRSASTASGTSAKTPPGDAAEERGAVRRALLDGGELDRESRARRRRSRSHRPRAPPPEARARSAGPPRSRTSSSESRRPNATPSSTARTSAPRSWRSSSPVKAPRARRVGVRRALTGEVRARRGARRRPGPTLGLGDEIGERRLRGEPVAQPLQRPGRGEHHAHRVPLPRDGVAEGVHARLRVGRQTPAAPRRRRPRSRSRSRAGPGRSIPTPSAAAAQSPAPAATGIPCATSSQAIVTPATAGDSRTGGSHRRIELEGVEHLGRPAAVGDVEQQRPGGVGDVDRPLARQPQPDVVLRQHDAGDPAVDSGSWRRSQRSFGAVKPGQRPVARERDQPLEADALLDLGALGRRALVVPEDRRAARPDRRRRGRRGRASDPRGRCRRSRAPAPELGERGLRRAPPVLRVLLRPARPRRRERIAAARRRRRRSPSGATAIALTPVVPTSRPTSTSVALSRHGRPRIAEGSGAGPPTTRSGATRSAACTTRRLTRSS